MAQQRIEAALAADRRAGGLQRFADGQPGGAPDRGQGRQRRSDQPDDDARHEHWHLDVEAGVDAEEQAARSSR